MNIDAENVAMTLEWNWFLVFCVTALASHPAYAHWQDAAHIHAEYILILAAMVAIPVLFRRAKAARKIERRRRAAFLHTRDSGDD
ncbi:MAG: hypothetical protein AAGD40_00830 [Pseudomonadota bacterium]